MPEVPEPSGDAFAKAVSLLLPYLLSHRSRLASLAGDPTLGAADPAPDAAEPRAGDPGASTSGSGESSLGHDASTGQPGVLDARGVDARGGGEGWEGGEARETGGSRGGAAGEVGESAGGELAELDIRQRRQLAEAVDTAILKVRTCCNVQHP